MDRRRSSYIAGWSLAIFSLVMLTWLSLGVGIIGRDGDPANSMYFLVLGAAFVVALWNRFRPLGLARAMVCAAVVQMLVAAVALLAKLGLPWSGPLELVVLNAIFVTLFAGAAWFFKRSIAI